jgi:hypothetical protein
MENNVCTSHEDLREDGCSSHQAAIQRDEATCSHHDEELEDGGNVQASPGSTSSNPPLWQLSHAQAQDPPQDQDKKFLPGFELCTGDLGQGRRDTKSKGHTPPSKDSEQQFSKDGSLKKGKFATAQDSSAQMPGTKKEKFS